MKNGRQHLIWIPNSFTAMNVLLGFLSILVSVNASLRPQAAVAGIPTPFDTACWLIIWATLFDILDGKLAKLTDTSSEFGMRLDTFADATTFGLAPAVLAFCAFLAPPQATFPYGWIACGAYFTAAVFRLARYNVQTSGTPRFGFTGLPTPAAALIVVSLYLSTRGRLLPPWLVASLLALIAVVMVSPIRYPAFKGLFPAEKKLVFSILMSMALATCFVGPALVLLVTFASFALLWGPLWIPLRTRLVPEAPLSFKKKRK